MKFIALLAAALLLGLVFAACNKPEAKPQVSGAETQPQSHAHHDHMPPVGAKLEVAEEEWKKRLTPEQFEILREKGTERAGTGALLKNKKDGVYRCAGCGAPLFTSETKFESGTGWPSFYDAIEGRVTTKEDRSYGMKRVEILCARCDGHLGHIFTDGPPPTGNRYCVNSLSLEFAEAGKAEAKSAK